MMKHFFVLSGMIGLLFLACAKPLPHVQQHYDESVSQRSAEKAFDAIRQAYDKDEFRTAIIQGEAFLARHKGNSKEAPVLQLVGDSYYRLDEYELAASYFEKFIKQFPHHPLVAEIHRSLGYTYLALNQPGETCRGFLGYLATTHDFQEKHSVISLIQTRLMNQLTESDLRRLLAQYPQTDISDELAYRLIRADLAAEREADAAIAISRFLVNYPNSLYYDEVRSWQKPGSYDPRDPYRPGQVQPGFEPGPHFEPATASGLKIGLICPVTGQYAKFGSSVIKAVELAFAIFQQETGIQLELVIRDSRGHSVEALRNAQDLIYNEKVIGIIGPILSEAVVSAGSIAQQARVPLITPTATDNEINYLGNYVLQFNNTNLELAYTLGHFVVKQLRLTNISILHPANPYGYDMMRGFSDAIFEAGGRVGEVLSYAPGQTDFQEQIEKLKQMKPEALFIPAQDNDLLLIVPQINHYELETQLLGGNGWNSEKLFRLEAKNIDSTYFVDSYFKDTQHALYVEFKNRFFLQNREYPDKAAALSFDAARFLTMGITERDMTPEKLYQQMLQIGSYDGITGRVSAFADGRIFKHPQIFFIENGSAQEVYWQEY